MENSMTYPNLRDAAARREETRKVSKGLLIRAVESAMGELEYLINATPTGDERNKLTEINIEMMKIRAELP